MNIKLLFKTILILAVLALLVMMGLNNPQSAILKMPPILPAAGLTQPAGYMYFGFFGVGFVVGALMMTGGGKKGASKPPEKK